MHGAKNTFSVIKMYLLGFDTFYATTHLILFWYKIQYPHTSSSVPMISAVTANIHDLSTTQFSTKSPTLYRSGEVIRAEGS